MKAIIKLIGVAIFWLAWPVWYVYFKLQPERTRVLVVVNDETLLLRGWVTGDKVSLAGGGKKRSETHAQAATRELEEETGIVAPETALELLGRRRCQLHGFKYRITYFVLRLEEKPKLKLRALEILEAYWIPIGKAEDYPLTLEVKFALKRYKPITQESLL